MPYGARTLRHPREITQKSAVFHAPYLFRVMKNNSSDASTTETPHQTATNLTGMNTNSSFTPSPTGPQAALFTPSRSLFQPFDLDAYVQQHGITGGAETFLREAAQAPSRSPNGYLSNTVRYPCPINGHTITAESNRYEFPFILTITTRPDVLRVFEQGPKLVIRGKTEQGHNYSFQLVVDAVVCTETGVEIYEVMAASEVAELTVSSANRFQEIGERKYGSRPAAEHFARWGFKHFIVTEHDMSPGYVQGADFLRPYRTGVARNPITEEEANTVIAAVKEEPGIFMEDIEIEPRGRRAEIIYHLLAKGEIFTHLSEGALTKQSELRLYPNAIQEQAFQLMRATSHKKPTSLKDLNYNLRVGTLIEIKGREYLVREMGRTDLVLAAAKDGHEETISFSTLLDMKPLIGKIYYAEKTFEAKLNDASPEDLLVMLRNYQLLQQRQHGLALKEADPSDRTIRRWKSEFAAKEATGVGIEALLPRKPGNSTSRIDQKVERLLIGLLNRYYLKPEGETAWWIFLRLTAINSRFRLGKTPAYQTVARHCAALDPYIKALKRGGKRHAMSWKPIYEKNLLMGNPAGIASWHRAHCDSTALDLLNPDDNNATIRLHLIKMVDSYDGRILCHCLTEESPSEETARMLMVKCVEQHRMLPATITFDWGPEGRSNWVQMTMEGLGVTLIFRPKATPISGANIETMFRKLCVELLHNLKGSTKHLQKARMITRAVDPRDRAVWTIPATRELLAEYYDMGNDLPRRNRRAPNLVAQESMRKFGMPPTQILDCEAFRQALLPFVDEITRIVSKRGTIRHREHSYYHNDLRFYVGKDVVVRFDKDDIQHVYVSLPDQRRRMLKCEVVDHALRYAAPEDAMRIHEETRKAIAEAKPTTIATKAAFVTRVSRKQKILQAEKNRKQRSPLAAEPPKPPQQKSPKIIPMPLNFTRLV